jgi:hypothetical protein
VPNVINKQAVSVEVPVFMATHTPFHRITYLKTPARLPSAGEDEFLGELRRQAARDQHVFAVILGIPGSGKSHLIRWLKESYSAQDGKNDHNDVVLLIERANNTLRQTLQQILDSGVFDATLFANQREKLARSASQLSEHGIEETLINHLQVAYVEDREKGAPALKPNLERHLNDFLLDSTVRSELCHAGGPIKRIARFLDAGNIRDTGDVLPEFRPDDFVFKGQFLHDLLQHARPDTRQLAEKLSQDRNRDELARYLNTLLEFAIGRTTALSSDDLKQMFNELRRELRRQGRSLAVFIEDITAFTGLDSGLIDILVTQHTGEGNRDFCRILSVVGVTDDYYRQRFPENVRDRISHHLTLNAAQSNVSTELLDTQDDTAALAARYLNAIRLAPERLQEWYDDGADPSRLPNACDTCPVLTACHTAFGAVSLSQGNGRVASVGLYPFNANALWIMYQRVNTNIALRTPRTLLNGIISYILISHSVLIDQGRFPPHRDEMGSEFGAPTLLKPEQRSLINAHNLLALDSDRLESLIVFWGDRTLNATQADGQPMLGTLPQAVFDAFDLPFIAGQVKPVEPPSKQTEGGEDWSGAGPKPGPQPPPTPPAPEEDPVVRDIEQWRAGKPLQNYNVLGQALTRFLRDAVDWESYGIPRALVEERVRQARFSIEGQSGRSASRYALNLARTDGLINALYAVHALERGGDHLSPDQLSHHLTSLSVWLAENEATLVDFVRAPQAKADGAPDLVSMQVQTVAALACLAGELNNETAQSPEAQARRLVRFCKGDVQWETIAATAEAKRGTKWARLIRNRQIASNANSVGESLLESLNCPQGRSRSVIYIDMASLLDAVEAFRKNDWQLASQENLSGEGNPWDKLIIVFNALAPHFTTVLEEERTQLQGSLGKLQTFVGGKTGREIDAAVKQFLDLLANAGFQPANGLDIASKPAFSTMETTVTTIRNLVEEKRFSMFAPAVSGIMPFGERLGGYLDYLARLKDFAEQRGWRWQEELDQAGDSINEVDCIRNAINQRYDDLATKLAALLDDGRQS